MAAEQRQGALHRWHRVLSDPRPSIVIAEFHGLSEIVPTKRIYDQRYIGVFHVEGGKITLFREYFDPAALSYAFALNEGGSFYGKN